MVAYLTDAMWWLQLKVDRDYISFKVHDLFLTPLHDWMQDWTQEWNREWDPDLMAITIQPNRRQKIISMLSGGTVGQFHEPTWGKGQQKWKFWLAPKCAVPVFTIFPVLWGFRLNPIPVFEGLTVIRTRNPIIQARSGIIPHTA